MGLIPESGRSPGEGNGNPLAWDIPWTEEPDGLQSIGRKESDMTLGLNNSNGLTYAEHLPRPAWKQRPLGICGLSVSSLGDLPNPGIEPGSPALQADSLPSELPGKAPV